jgi:hypothetical protein
MLQEIGRPQGFYLDFYNAQILEIDCSSRLVGKIIEWEEGNLELLKVHCTIRSQISRLANQKSLKQVWLIGSRDEALKQDLEHQLAEHP